MNKTKMFRGLSATLLSAFSIFLVGSIFAEFYGPVINGVLDLNTSKVVTPAGKAGPTRFASEFGEFNEDNEKKLIQAEREQTYNESAEGAVLLYNKNNALPLKAAERSVSFFGRGSVDIISDKPGTCPGLQNPITLRDALDSHNFSVNETLWNAYEGRSEARNKSTGDIGEVPFDFYTSDIKNSWATSYNDVAFIVLVRDSSEGSDLFHSDADGVSSLALHEKERQMIDMVSKDTRFKKRIVLLNTGAPMELDWIYEYNIDSVLWFGSPGETGMDAIVDILVGEVNPSGHLVDSYAANSLSAPSAIGSADQTQRWANLTEIKNKISDNIDGCRSYVVSTEGIYVGYKYYETRYEDCILSQGSANGDKGIWNSKNHSWNYADEMVFTYGYGLSYTTFSQTLNSVTDNGDGTMTMKVTVKNTGSVAGKSVVEAYVQTPYGQYEKTNYVEKASVSFIQFDKTKLLEPGESQNIELVVDKYLMASYDYINAKGYIMSEGDYYLAIGSDAHDALNNILTKKGATGLYDALGNPVTGDTSKVFKWSEAFDSETYKNSEETGNRVTNQFDDCNPTFFYEDKTTTDFFISRQDWQGTYPSTYFTLSATEKMMKYLDNYFYETPDNAAQLYAETTIGKYQGITLVDMIGVDYDDPKWEKYMDQFTLDELAHQTCDGAGTKLLEKFVKPATKHADGIDGNGNGVLPYAIDGNRTTTNQYGAKVMLTSTYNRDIYRRRGEMLGEDDLWTGMECHFNIGNDIHRNVFCGRNPEYMSEDAIMNYLASQPECAGQLSKGVTPCAKHFAGNTQETDRGGVSMLFTEQSWREADLRAFEGSLRVAKIRGLMEGLNRVGLRYGPTVYALHTTVLRDEWGFKGRTETDGCNGLNFKTHWTDMVHAGTDVYCLDSTGVSGKAIVKAIKKNNDGQLLKDLRRAIKNYHYVTANGCSMNGLSNDVVVVSVTPWWETMIYIVNPTLAVLACGSIAGYIFFKLKDKKSKKEAK